MRLCRFDAGAGAASGIVQYGCVLHHQIEEDA